jgi:hypothetical protein
VDKLGQFETHNFLLECEYIMVEEFVELLIGVIDANCKKRV